MPHPTIRNIIFDLGKVLLPIDYALTSQAFANLGFNLDVHFTQLKQIDLFDQLETGKVSEMAFYDELRKLGGDHLSYNQLRDAWNALLLDFPIENLHLIQRLRKDYRIYMLSNINAIHEPAYLRIMNRYISTEAWHGSFDKVYYSHHIGMRKPHKETYAFVLQDAGLLAAETLFLDDLQKNIDGAKEVGLNTWLVDKPVVSMLAEF